MYMASWIELLGFMGPQINRGGMIQYSNDSISNDTHTLVTVDITFAIYICQNHPFLKCHGCF